MAVPHHARRGGAPPDTRRLRSPIGRKTDPNDPLGPLAHQLRVFLIDAKGEVRNIFTVGFLDPRLVREVTALLRLLDDLKRTLVVVSHDMDFAQAISDQVIYFEGGRAVESGTAREVFSNPRRLETRAFMESFHDGRAQIMW